MRDADGLVSGIVEHSDADDGPAGRSPRSTPGSTSSTPTIAAGGAGRDRADNAQGELYLTDVVPWPARPANRSARCLIDDRWQTEGINDRSSSRRMNAELNRRILQRWMRAGVTVVDPATTWVHASVDLAPDVTLLPGTSLEGATSVAAGATIGPDTTLVDVEVGEGATVTRTHGSLSVIGPGANVGPFAYLRPGTTLGAGGKIGTFVETKNAHIGAGAKAPHLSYPGDAVIGEGANIGAGVIFANYDGVTKSTTTVGAHELRRQQLGAGRAGRSIADGAYVAAGSTITGDVGPGELAVSRSRQRNVAGWVARKRAGTKTARAAERAASDNSRRSRSNERPQEAQREAPDALLRAGLPRAG